MREDAHVVQAMEEARKAKRKVALATVVRVLGSAYRREGAKMIIDEHGNVTGMLSGGCLEPDVAEAAKKVMEQEKPALKSYVMDEDVVWGLGLGCPGTVEVYIEPLLSGKWNECCEAWMAYLQEEKAGVLVTLLDEVPELSLFRGNRLFVPESFLSDQSSPISSLGHDSLNQQVTELAYEKIRGQYPKSETRLFTLSNGKKVNVFFDVIIPPTELMIFGAGHDAIPLAKSALALGFKTTVVDPRPAYNTPERFSGAKRILAHASEFQEQLTIGQRTYVVIMNHHLERDQESLKFVLNAKVPYVGLLGPYSRRQRILKTLEGEEIIFQDKQLACLYSPVGLDIGADTSEEIALSILTEILAVRNGHAGGSLRERSSIHQPVVR